MNPRASVKLPLVDVVQVRRLVTVAVLGIATLCGSDFALAGTTDAGAAVQRSSTSGETAHSPVSDSTDRDFYWLEDLGSARTKSWIQARNAEAAHRFARDSRVDALISETQKDVEQTSGGLIRLVSSRILGRWVYEFAQDDAHPSGVLRRASVESYGAGTPEWRVFLDVAELSKRDGVTRTFSSLRNGGSVFTCLAPEFDRCLLAFGTTGDIRGVVYEVDAASGTIVADGFNLTTPFLHEIDWFDADHVLVSTDFGPGSVTAAGYGRVVKLWKRGTPLSTAKTVLECAADSFACYPRTIARPEGVYNFVVDLRSTISLDTFFVNADGKARKLQFASSAATGWKGIQDVFDGEVIAILYQDWRLSDRVVPAGTLVSVPLDALLAGPASRDVHVVFAPTAAQAVETTWGGGVRATRTGLYVSILENVSGKILRFEKTSAGWSGRAVDLPSDGSVILAAANPLGTEALVSYQSFLTPPSEVLLDPEGRPKHLSAPKGSLPASRFRVEQHWVTSADGTDVPYFIVFPKDMVHDGRRPVLMTAYGGAGINTQPMYLGDAYHLPERAILESGGAFVLVNVRGGGEFGPNWKNAVLSKNRHKQFEDLEAAARDLIRRRITSPVHLGFTGASYGGLVAGVMLTRYPRLFGAVYAGVPVLDLIREHTYPYGTAMVGELGNPDDPEIRPYLESYSPYQVVNAKVNYPPVLFATSSNDRQAHPANARRMAAKMLSQGHDAVYFYEWPTGGHSGATTEERVARKAFEAMFFLRTIARQVEAKPSSRSH